MGLVSTVDHHMRGKSGHTTTELAVDLADAAGLEASSEDFVELLAASANPEACLAFLEHFSTGQESRLRLMKCQRSASFGEGRPAVY